MPITFLGGEQEIVFPPVSTTHGQVKPRASPFSRSRAGYPGADRRWERFVRMLGLSSAGVRGGHWRCFLLPDEEMSLQAASSGVHQAPAGSAPLLKAWAVLGSPVLGVPLSCWLGRWSSGSRMLKWPGLKKSSLLFCVCFLSCIKSVVEKARPHPYCYFCFRCNTHVLNLFAKPRLDRGFVPDLTITSRALGILA